jgi:hypothetical protein
MSGRRWASGNFSEALRISREQQSPAFNFISRASSKFLFKNLISPIRLIWTENSYSNWSGNKIGELHSSCVGIFRRHQYLKR